MTGFLTPETPYPVKVQTVNELTRNLKSLIEKDDGFQNIWIQAEVSNLVKAASGHCYLTLKDDKAVIKAALWAGNRRRIGKELKNGEKIMVFGSVSVYAPRGEYQVIIQDFRASGLGDLYEAFEKLKQKLKLEGLFDTERKIPVPALPKGVGVVTSPTGAVIKDIFRVVRRRFPNMPIYLVPARVQGEGAAAEIVQGIKRLQSDKRVDLIIIARGGGSLEDLWPFNEEVVARTISACNKPVISAVGHETDTTIADLVADVRAATPSVAGELAVPVKMELKAFLLRQKNRLERATKVLLKSLRQRLIHARACRFLKQPALLVAERRMKVMNLSRELEISFQGMFQKARSHLELLSARLSGLNPKTLLARGFILAVNSRNEVVTKAANLKSGELLTLNFADGTATAEVKIISKEEN